MKLLETIGMVQFFLYEREDLEIGRNTAFFGPNGTGKTALLDAIQTVMLAADGSRTHFNAAGDGKKHARSLRDYCLGVYDQTEEGRCRDSANTYINLVFRDEQTDSVVTAGVSLAASASSTELTFNALYILPGVALMTAAHVEREAGKDKVLPWRRFQHVAKDLCHQAGTQAQFFTSNKEEFINRLLVEHLAAPGDKPNAQAVRSAFARSLKLAKDVDDISTTLRTHLIEPYRTNVKDFRARLDQFRTVRDLIRGLTARIERAEAVEDKYKIVQRERTAETNLNCLKAVYRTERLGETLSTAEDSIKSLETELTKAISELKRALHDAQSASDARDRAIETLNQDPEYRQQSGHADIARDREAQFTGVQQSLSTSLKAMELAVVSAGRYQRLLNHRGIFEDATNQIIALSQLKDAEQRPDTTAIHSAVRSVHAAYEVVRRASNDADNELKAAQARKKEAEIAIERSNRGLAALRDNTLTLQRILADANIKAEPVCDLVIVTDPTWQPAIESYLGPHIDALLVPTHQETAAVEIYRGLKGSSRVYGVKLALPSRIKEWNPSGQGEFAAALIQGKNKVAVRYLQGELGRIQLANNSEQLRTLPKGMTADGMIGSGGGIERRRLAGPDELKIDRGNNSAARKRAELDFSDSMAALKSAAEEAGELNSALNKLAAFADTSSLEESIENQFNDINRLALMVIEARRMLGKSQTKSLAALQSLKTKADERYLAADQHKLECTKQQATLETTLMSQRQQLDGLRHQIAMATAQERECRMQPLYNPNEVERHRTRLDEHFEDKWEEKEAACLSAINKAKVTADNADREAWSLFMKYAADYNLQNHDISSADWLRAQDYIRKDKERLKHFELHEQMEKSEEAYLAAVKVFRTDVAQALLTGFDRIEEQMLGLNKVLENAPEFSNSERYKFRCKVVDMHRPLYDFLRRVREQGTAEEDIFGGSGKIPDEFRTLVEGDGNSELLNETSPLNDHRRFFSYDVEIFREGKSIGWLSKRLGPGSGGEHRTPLYVIFGAALAASYGKTSGSKGGGGLMLLDEAFEKMDPQNVRATAQYLNALGLQMILAGPETDQPKMSSFLDIYYDMARYGSRTIQMDKIKLSDAARDLLQSDNFLGHPELIDAEVKRLQESANVTS
jgi:chromosome segregation protein